MQVWGSYAGWLSVGLVVAGAYLVLTMRRRFSRIVFVLLSVPIPAAGLALYALDPGPSPQLNWLTWLAASLIALGLVAPFWRSGMRAAMQPGKSVTVANVASHNRVSLAARGCGAVGITAYVAIFEPIFGIANLAAICIWIGFCMPRRWRHLGYELSVDLRAQPGEVYRFLLQPSNWPRYQENLELVTPLPDGPLTIGSEVTTRQAVPWSGSGANAKPTWVSITTRFTALEPDASYTAVTVGRDDKVTTAMQESGSGTRLTIRADRTLPRAEAILGMMLEYRAQLVARRRVSLKALRRLDELTLL
jgi:hypothetical protein